MISKWGLRILAILSLWAVWGYIVLKINPEMVRDVGWTESYLPFYITLGLAMLYTTTVVGKSVVRGLLTTAVIVVQLILMQLRIMTPIILILSIAGIVAMWWLAGKRRAKVREDSTFDNESEEQNEE